MFNNIAPSIIKNVEKSKINAYLNSGPSPKVSPTLMKYIGHKSTVIVQNPNIPKQFNIIKYTTAEITKYLNLGLV